jgi:two-component system, LytTR family, response regulator AlgR
MRVLIADDEPLARQRLRDLLADITGFDVVAEAANGREACELADQLTPDVVLLDIAMPVLDGLEAAHHLSRFDPAPAVVFCTAYDDHALAAFDARAVDYLVKPIRRERLVAALERARRYTGDRADHLEQALPQVQTRTHLCARLRGSLRLIPLDEIRYLQADEKYVVVHHSRGEDLIEDSLKALELEFGDRFLRIHRNCLVARQELQELKRDNDGRVHVKLHHVDVPLEVSRRCLPQLRQRARLL